MHFFVNEDINFRENRLYVMIHVCVCFGVSLWLYMYAYTDSCAQISSVQDK